MEQTKMNVLAEVHRAKIQVGKLLNSLSGTDPEFARLELLEATLGSIEDDLILKVLTKQVAQLRKASAKLATTVTAMKKDREKIKKVAERVKQAAAAVKLLADLAAKASSFGIA
jgi:hypothetical protein